MTPTEAVDTPDRECGHYCKVEMCQKDDAIKVYDVMLHVSVTLTRSVVSIRTPERGRGVSQGDVITVYNAMLQVAVTPTGAMGYTSECGRCCDREMCDRVTSSQYMKSC